MVAALAVATLGGLASGPLGVDGHPVQQATLDALAVVVACAGGVGLVSGLKWYLAFGGGVQAAGRLVDDRHGARADAVTTPLRDPVLVRLCLPSNLDLLVSAARSVPAVRWLLS
jgi:hypothetical protein